MKFTDDKFEHALLITLTFGAVRMLSYTSGSLFNPAFAFRYFFFNSTKIVLNYLNVLRTVIGEDLDFCGYTLLDHSWEQLQLLYSIAKSTRNSMIRKLNMDYDNRKK